MAQKQITLEQILKGFGETLKSQQYSSMPGIVKAFYPGTPATIDVQPAVHDVRFDLDGSVTGTIGDRISEPWPVIPRVPVCYPSGGGFLFKFPLNVGDKVELVADDLDPTVFRQTGNASDPQDVRRHSGGYWKALPCDITDTFTPSFTVEFDGTSFSVGGTSDAAALASAVHSELQAIAKTLASLAGGGGSPATFGSPYTGPGSVSSTKLKLGG